MIRFGLLLRRGQGLIVEGDEHCGQRVRGFHIEPGLRAFWSLFVRAKQVQSLGVLLRRNFVRYRNPHQFAGRYFNGLLVMNEDGDGWYYKRHLVPFGEYFPVPGFVRSWMRLMSLPYDDISAGPEHQPSLRAAGQHLGLTICYEDAFGSSQLDVLRDATLLINVTNNAWYGDSTAPHQHLQIARMRALEAGRFLIRAANDGITAVIGPHGELAATLPQFKEAVLRTDVQPLTGLTPYARVGNYPVVGGALGLLALTLLRRRRAGD